MYKGIRFKEEVDIERILRGFRNMDNRYELRSMYDEFVIVKKDTREIIQEGYNGLLCQWRVLGYLEGFN